MRHKTSLIERLESRRMLDGTAGQLDVTSLVTHRFRMDDFLGAYETFADPAHSGALKVLITAE